MSSGSGQTNKISKADRGHRKNKETHAGSSSISSTMRGAGRDGTTRPVAAGKDKAIATEIENGKTRVFGQLSLMQEQRGSSKDDTCFTRYGTAMAPLRAACARDDATRR